MQHLTLECKTIFFKTLGISRIVFLSLTSKVLADIISKLKKTKKLWWSSKPKIKQYLQCSWVRKSYDNSFHECNIIPLKITEKSFGSHTKFHANLLFNISCICDFPSFYQDIFCNWIKYFSSNPETRPCILS